MLGLLDQLNKSVDELSAAVQQEAEKRPEVRLLMTHPGVGPITALAFVLIIGYPERFRCGKQIGSYIGLIPEEASSGVHRRLGHISKQGSSLLRFLLVEAAQAAARFNPEWRSKFLHVAMRRETRIAKVAMARKLAVSLYWMWRKETKFSAVSRSRFVRGIARNGVWCAVDHRYTDRASRSLNREFELVIMVDVLTGEMLGSD